MNTLQIPQRNIYTEYASAWDEILLKDAAYIGKCLWMLERNELDVDMFRKLVADRLINRRNSIAVPTEGTKAWDMWANEGKIADTVNFFFKIKKEKVPKQVRDDDSKQVRDDGADDVVTETYEVIPDFVKNIVAYVKLRGQRYYGPGDFLSEMSFAEYKDLLFCADKYMQTKDEQWLTRMMAISYRRRRLFLPILKRLPDFNGRTRLKYQAGAVDFRMKRFEKLAIGSKYMFFQYVMGCMYHLKNSDGIEVDGHLCNFSLMFNRKSNDNDDNDSGVGLTGVMMVLAESGVFGNIKQTAEADVWEVLIRLYQLELQRMEIDRKMK